MGTLHPEVSSLTVPSPDAIPVVGDFTIVQQVTTRWADVDVYGHVNNSIYYSLVDTAVNAWLMRATGKDTRARDDIFVVAETSCRYRSEVNFPGVVDIGLSLERLGRSSVVYQFGIFAGGSEAARAHGRYVHVNVHAQSRVPQAMPQDVRDVIAQLPGAKEIT